MALNLGDVIDGKYTIVRLLGEGGMGAVYEGENTRIHRKVAIKVLHVEVAANDEATMRFEREAQAAGRIGSEHIVEVLDLGDLPGGERYMVMEYLEGEALSDRIAKGRMDPAVIARLMVDMLEGLGAAHRANIVHRDLKPDNVFLLTNRGGKSDFVKIVDFGISKFNSLGGEFSMTRTGAVMGTPYYMAPEQAKGGKAVDHRVDLYAVGVILYQAVVGVVPFQAETFNELLFKIVLETPPPLEDQVPGIDPGFVNVVTRAMARDPDARYQSATEFQQALKTWLSGGKIPKATVTAGTPYGDTLGIGSVMNTPGAWERLPGADGVSGEDPLQDDPELPVKKGPNLVVLGAAAALVLVGVGVFAFLSGGDSEQTAAAGAEQAEAAAAATRASDTERAAAMKELEEQTRQAEQARLAAEKARDQAEASTSRLAAEEAAAQKTAATQKTAAEKAQAEKKPAVRATTQASAPSTAAPAPRPAPAPAPATTTSPSGRPIRTSF